MIGVYHLAFGVTAGGLGAFFLSTMVNRARFHKSERRTAWLLVTAIFFGLVLWSTQLVLLLAQYGSGFKLNMIVLSCVCSVALSAPALSLCYSSSNKHAILLGRILIAVLAPPVYFLNFLAFTTFSAPILTFIICALVYMAAMGLGIVFYMRDRQSPTLDPRRSVVLVSSINLALHFAFAVSSVQITEAHVTSGIAFELTAALIAALTLSLAGLTILIDSDSGRETAEKFRKLAMQDTLTGQANRLQLNVTLERALISHTDPNAQIAIIVMDLDNFKEVNDVHGHAIGDALLKGIAQDIASVLEDKEMLARTGGDEFVVLKFNIREKSEAHAFATRVLNAVKDFEAWMTGDISVGASLGVCVFPQDGNSTEQLLSRADMAMYRAKQMGRNRVCLFDEEMDEQRRKEAALKLDLSRALDESELSLLLQPQFDILSREVVGFEALMQWTHPERGVIPSDEIVPIAESSGLIREIGFWMLQNACKEAAGWSRPYRIAVNVSAVQLGHVELVSDVRAALESSGLAPPRLELEITESELIADKDAAIAAMTSLQRLGIGIAMDDFGTGYASLSNLRSFPYDKLKLDRAFIGDLEDRPADVEILKAAIAISRALDIPILAEGVETAAQLEILAEAQCDEVQGYLFSKPISIDAARVRYRLDKDTTMSQYQSLNEPTSKSA